MAYCKVLAAEYGFNVLLVSRNEDKLKKCVAEVYKYVLDYNSEILVNYEICDFSKISTIEEYKQRFTSIFNNYDIAICINNAGVGHAGYFTEITDREL